VDGEIDMDGVFALDGVYTLDMCLYAGWYLYPGPWMAVKPLDMYLYPGPWIVIIPWISIYTLDPGCIYTLDGQSFGIPWEGGGRGREKRFGLYSHTRLQCSAVKA
jgi:hypothetical protein